MRITGLDVRPVQFKLSEPYTIAYESVGVAHNIFVRLKTDSALTGYGCAAPDLQVTRETPEMVLDALEHRGRNALVGMDPSNPAQIYQLLRDQLGFLPSTLAALDMACWDLLAKFHQVPLWRFLGGSKSQMRTSMTIGILGGKETVDEARRWLEQGFSFLKIKGGLDVEMDVRRVLMVRQAVGDSVQLAFDANQGLSVAQALSFLRGTQNAGLLFLEQPTPRAALDQLEEVQRQSPIPIMADESLTTFAESEELARRKAVQLFNIKLMKVGGICAALQIDALAQQHGIRTMIGCLDESALGIAAGLHFALARSNVKYADLDGHFALVDDPAAAAIECRDGILCPDQGAGLGYEME
jgi:L-alanine-DL-glutamate epimerase-like enolase superfamily enzyme